MTFCQGTYFTHILDWFPNNQFQPTLDSLKALGLEFAFGIDTDFNRPGHGSCIRDMMFFGVYDTNPYFAERDLYLLKRPYFALALMDASDEYVACLIAHWDVTSRPTDARVVIDLVEAPHKYTSILFDVMESMFTYLWLTEEEGGKLINLKEKASMELIVYKAMLQSDHITALDDRGYSKIATQCTDSTEILSKNLVFRV
jgi:hypothetical protein